MAKQYLEVGERQFQTKVISEEDVTVKAEDIQKAVTEGARKNAEHSGKAPASPLSWIPWERIFPDQVDKERPEVAYHPDRITTELIEAGHDAPRALVCVQGMFAKGIFMGLAEAGLATVAPQTGDRRIDVNPKLALRTVPLGTKPSKALFTNAHAILQAAMDAQVQAIFLGYVAAALAKDDRFLRRAADAGIRVFRPFEPDTTRQFWLECKPKEATEASAEGEVIAPGRWQTCHSCKLTFDEADFAQNDSRCPQCQTLSRMASDVRIADILDDGVFEEWDQDVPDVNPLSFAGYPEKIAAQREKTGLDEAVRTGFGYIGRVPVAFGIMDPAFFMGSMGSVVGEKVARLFDRATDEGLPVVLFCASGGARMQEGIVSLMQMAKTSCAIERHDRAGLLYVSVLTDPTTGGVTASFATLGDIILSEPETLIGFAGQRVIRDTIKQDLPEGFQTAEFALEHGLIDAIVERSQMRRALKTILRMHACPIDDRGRTPEDAFEVAEHALDAKEQRRLERHAKQELRKSGVMGAAQPGSAWESVQLARNAHRPTSRSYIRGVADAFFELHGDRQFADDGAIIGGIGMVDDRPVTIIAQEKGADLKDRIRRNFGCPQPEGYRKAARLMRQAQKFGRPIVCFVDTQGAFCGTGAEERGQGNAIAESLQLMAGLTVPVISIILGEGGSGGALAMAVANKVAMQEHAVYSILSPEGFASILWKDGKRAPEAAEAMQMDAAHVSALGVVDEVISEGEAPAHENPEEAVANVRQFVGEALRELSLCAPEELRAQRQARFAAF